MSNFSDSDKASFLQQGAIFAKENKVFLFWGEPLEGHKRPEAVALSSSSFFSKEEPIWKLFPYKLEMTRTQALVHFSKLALQIPWHEPTVTLFKKHFEKAQQSFKTSPLKKVVPYTIERGDLTVGTRELESFVASALRFEQGYLYGEWSRGTGLLGVTPEILLTQNSVNQFETMALAGTRGLSEFEKDREGFLTDSKEREEHQSVVDDIKERLSQFGEVEVGDQRVLKTPHLAHLMTPIQLKTIENHSLQSMVQELHPTPALGGRPRSEALPLLEEFEADLPRKKFGAPFGISYSKNQGDFIVAIRNLQWEGSSVEVMAGCGVITASVFDREWEELSKKRQSIKRIFGVR